jgi:hypothetical protein
MENNSVLILHKIVYIYLFILKLLIKTNTSILYKNKFMIY